MPKAPQREVTPGLFRSLYPQSDVTNIFDMPRSGVTLTEHFKTYNSIKMALVLQ